MEVGTQALVQARTQPGSILEDERYSEDVRYWVANQLDKRGYVGAVSYETQRVKELKDAISNRNFESMRQSPRLIGLGLTRTGHSGIRPPEFDLLEQAALYDAEPLAKAAIQRQLDLWFKQGYRLVGPNKKLNTYINDRLNQIALISGIPIREMLRTVVRSLLKYSNAFLIKVRNAELSGGIRKPGRPLPIAGLFPVSPMSIFPEYENGSLVRWVRILKDGTRVQRFDRKDVLHLTFDKEEDFLFGKPRMLGAVEDVAALRRIEENIEILLAKFLNPIFQLMVGTDNDPCKYYPNGTSELDAAKGMIQDMEQEGMLITSERHKLDVVGAFNQAMDATEYLKHFKNRLYTGLGTSAVDMGEGDTANRSTADNISQNLKDRVIADQVLFTDQLQMFLFADLIAEHPDDLSVWRNYTQVGLRFFNVDLDNRIKYEAHVTNLFNNNLLNEDESREELGRQPFTEGERSRTHFNLIDVPIAVIGAGDEKWSGKIGKGVLATVQPALGDPKQTPTGAIGTGGGAGNKGGGSRPKKDPSKPSSAPAREVGVRVQPENQFGKNPGPTKRKSSVDPDGNTGIEVKDGVEVLPPRTVRADTDEQLIGTRLCRLVDALALAKDKGEVEEEISKRFPEESDHRHILPVVTNAYSACTYRAELRAALVAGLIPLADRFRDEEES